MDDARTITLLLAALLVGCEEEVPGTSLERICATDSSGISPTPACRLTGDAQMTTGVTADSLALRFGSGSGALEVRLNAITAASTAATWTLEVLSAARPMRPEGNLLFRSIDYGSCDAVTCPDQPPDTQAALTEDFQWARMVDNIAGSLGRALPDDAILVLRGADIDILDFRTPGFDLPEDPPF